MAGTEVSPPTHPVRRSLTLLALVLAALCLIAPAEASALSHAHHAGLHGNRVAVVAVADHAASTLRADASAVNITGAAALALLAFTITAGTRRIARQATVDSIRTRGPPRDAAL
jgi:hypothetical protein